MIKTILTAGLIGGLIVGVPLFAMAASWSGAPPSWGAALGYTLMLVAFSLIFVAVKRYRDHELGGVIRFLPAFGMGLAIAAIASLIYVIAWEAALAVTGMDFAADYVNHLIEAEKAKGASPEAIAKMAADMEMFLKSYANPLYRVPLTLLEIFPLGALVSLVTALILRNPRVLALRRG
jgi:hypothetical protein